MVHCFLLARKTVSLKDDFTTEMSSSRYGVAEIVMSDQGQEFVDRVNEVLFKLCGMDHRIRSAY